jgi:hypothetical protein
VFYCIPFERQSFNIVIYVSLLYYLLTVYSAGIGRTGTFIALDALYEHGQETGYVDIMEYVQRMRKDRMNMIQTKVSFIIKCTAPILKLTHAFETISYVISVVYCRHCCYLIDRKHDLTMI